MTMEDDYDDFDDNGVPPPYFLTPNNFDSPDTEVGPEEEKLTSSTNVADKDDGRGERASAEKDDKRIGAKLRGSLKDNSCCLPENPTRAISSLSAEKRKGNKGNEEGSGGKKVGHQIWNPSSNLTQRQTDEVLKAAGGNSASFTVSRKLSFYQLSVFVAISIFGLFEGAKGTLVVAPKDVVALKGEEVRFPCSTKHPFSVYWERIVVGADAEQTIYYGKNGMVINEGITGRFTVDSDSATGRQIALFKVTLIISSRNFIPLFFFSTTKNYTSCWSNYPTCVTLETDYFSCEMPIPEGGFMGENIVNLPEDKIQASCSFEYRGHVTPHIHWRLDDGTRVGAIKVNERSTVRSMVTFRGTKQMNGAILSSFPTTASSDQRSEHNAVSWWTSPPLKVNYMVLEFGEEVSCKGGSAMIPVCNPECEYQHVEDLVKGQCSCDAVYNLNHEKHDIVFHKYTCYASESTRNEVPVALIAVGAAFGVVAVILALIAGLVCRHIRQLKKAKDVDRTSNDQLMPSDSTA